MHSYLIRVDVLGEMQFPMIFLARRPTMLSTSFSA